MVVLGPPLNLPAALLVCPFSTLSFSHLFPYFFLAKTRRRVAAQASATTSSPQPDEDVPGLAIQQPRPTTIKRSTARGGAKSVAN